MLGVLRTIIGVLAAAILSPDHASAQIFLSRDADGTTVLSNRAVNAPTPIYAVPGAPSYRTTNGAVATNAERFEPLVQEHAARHSLRPELVRAVIQVESGFNPAATSPKGAMGLMQLMPATARSLGVVNAYDPEENIRGGTAYLRQLLDKFKDEKLALAAYNAGPGAVDRYDGVPPYRETQEYVRKVASKAGTVPTRPRTVLYKFYEIVNDEIVPKFSQTPPNAGTYDVLAF